MRRPHQLSAAGTAILLFATGIFMGGCPGGGVPTGGGGFVFNLPPVVVLSADLVRGIAPLTVQFNSGASTDDGLIVRREWDFGDDQSSREIAPRHTFVNTGEYTVRLTVTDDEGASTTRSVVISVTIAPIASLVVDRTSAPTAPALFNFDASASSDPDGTIASYQWSFGDGSGEVLPVVPHTYARPGAYRVRLTVTDNTGVTGIAETVIEVGIPQPSISFLTPPPDITNIVVSPDSPLWVYAKVNVEPGVPHVRRAGLDLDRDPCDANATIFASTGGEQLSQLTGPEQPVTSLAFSPDSGLLLIGSQDRTAYLFDTLTGVLVRQFGGHTDAVNAVAYSPDGTQVVTGSADGTAIIHDVNSGAAVRTLTASGAVSAVAFSPDGASVLTGAEPANNGVDAAQQALAVLWNASTGAQRAQFVGHTARVTSVAFTSDGGTVVTGSVDRSARLWDAASGTLLLTLSGHTNTVNAVATFSADNLTVIATASSDLTIRVWDAAGGTLLQTLSGHSDRVTSVAFSPDGAEVLSGGADGTARQWSRATGAQTRSLKPCVSTVASVVYAPDGGRVALGIAARNSIQLDAVDQPNGGDLNITVPVPLDLSDVPANQAYFLWAEVDTDRTDPARTYSNVDVNVIPAFTATIEDATPEIIFDENNSAAVVVAPTTDRQIFSLGELQEGDRLIVSLLGVPGYNGFHDLSDPYSVLILDNSTDPNDPSTLVPEMFAWYQLGFVLFNANTRTVIGHDGTYYVVIDGIQGTFSRFDGVSLLIRKVPDFGVTKRAQRVYLNFAGSSNVKIGGFAPVSFGEFDAADVRTGLTAADTDTLKNRIVETIEALYVDEDDEPFDIEFVRVDDPSTEIVQPALVMHFGAFGFGVYGVADYIDPRNDTLTGTGIIFTDQLGEFPPLDVITVDELGQAIGRIAAHETGHLLGLRHTEGTDELMNSGELNDPTSPALRLRNSPLRSTEEYNGQIGNQNAPRLLEEIIGLAP
ncbi:MAG: hypothetical protein CHACPFDD_03554 [Phycisphaerae bacterium]|nr:hypothetical protein [Phycisphaerae bacterium]